MITNKLKMEILEDLRIEDLQIIGQTAEKEFILCYHRPKRRIICIDQHAADERIKYESLLDHLEDAVDLEPVKTRACHHAIKFGHKLNLSECYDLVDKLLKCKVPFKCAHSRCSTCVFESLDKIILINRLRDGSVSQSISQ